MKLPSEGGGGLHKRFIASLKRWSREPLLLFLVIGAAMFAIYAVLNPGSGRSHEAKRIELTTNDLRQLEIAFAAQWNRPPNPEEAAGIVQCAFTRRFSIARHWHSV